ncbi:MAG TPA: hypothetical protein VK579_14160, partial [Terriglobales bacterium]|nr:hypothetical protein [Terriglobales bacterium]
MLGDRGYDAEAIRRGLRARHIVPFLAKRNSENGSGLGSGADVRLVESVVAAARSLRKAGGHSRGILVLGVRYLPALSASRFAGELK